MDDSVRINAVDLRFQTERKQHTSYYIHNDGKIYQNIKRYFCEESVGKGFFCQKLTNAFLI